MPVHRDHGCQTVMCAEPERQYTHWQRQRHSPPDKPAQQSLRFFQQTPLTTIVWNGKTFTSICLKQNRNQLDGIRRDRIMCNTCAFLDHTWSGCDLTFDISASRNTNNASNGDEMAPKEKFLPGVWSRSCSPLESGFWPCSLIVHWA